MLRFDHLRIPVADLDRDTLGLTVESEVPDRPASGRSCHAERMRALVPGGRRRRHGRRLAEARRRLCAWAAQVLLGLRRRAGGPRRLPGPPVGRALDEGALTPRSSWPEHTEREAGRGPSSGAGCAPAASPARLNRRPAGGAQDEGVPLRRSAPPPPPPPAPITRAAFVNRPGEAIATTARSSRDR